jgi:hypothetical protein
MYLDIEVTYLHENLAINTLFQGTWEATERKSEAKDLDLDLIQLSKSEPLMENMSPRSCAMLIKKIVKEPSTMPVVLVVSF